MLEQIITNRIHKRGFMSEQKQKTIKPKKKKIVFPQSKRPFLQSSVQLSHMKLRFYPCTASAEIVGTELHGTKQRNG